MQEINLKDMDICQLSDFFTHLGEPHYRAKQVFKWINEELVENIDEMTNLPKPLREKLQNTAALPHFRIVKHQKDYSDGTVKYLFELTDGALIESVRLVHNYGVSVCISSQVGCKMGCVFCASCIGGFQRNLRAWEMLEQVRCIAKQLGDLPEEKKRISSVVVMGSGEPLENIDELKRFIDMINASDGFGIGHRHITVSTCGLPEKIRKLAQWGCQITLAISLHAPNDTLRSSLMPVNRAYPLRELIAACRYYIDVTGRRVTFEYALMDGVNDTDHYARELGILLKGLLCHVNLIPLNPVAEKGLRGSSKPRVKRFQEIISSYDVAVTIRRELGQEIDAACGQLRARTIQEN